MWYDDSMQKLRNLKHIFVVIVLSLSVVFGWILLFSEFNNPINGFFIYRTGSNQWQDNLYKHTIIPENDIAVIKIDNESLDALQAKWNLKMLTIPKSNYIALIEKLEAAWVKWIAFDIIFENADKDEVLFEKTLSKYDNIVIASENKASICSDKLNEFIKKTYFLIQVDSRKEVMLDTFWIIDPDKIIQEEACWMMYLKVIKRNLKLLKSNFPWKYDWADDIDVSKLTQLKIQEYSSKFLCEKDSLSEFSTCPWVPRSVYSNIEWGTVNMWQSDAFKRMTYIDIRMMPYSSWISSSWLYSLPIALYIKTHTWLTQDEKVWLRKYSLNPYFWPWGSYSTVSFIDSLEMWKTSAINTFKWKYVFIWESGTAIHDSVVSPVNKNLMSWVELHAHYLDGLLYDKMLNKIEENTFFIVLISLTILLSILYYSFPSLFAVFLAISFTLWTISITRYYYDINRVLIDIAPLLISCFFTFFITFTYRFFIVDREKRQLKSNFAHYIDSHVVDEIVKNSDSIELGGEKRELSVLFSDIAGFTSISETMDTRELFYLMTTYLSYMTDIMIKEGWTLDKYIWDAVMGFFGAPISQEDHAIRSANTAILMRKALAKFNMEIGARGIESIDFRVWIASGEVMVGNIGSKDRFNYTVLWDTVNLASRLEWTGKEYEVHIIISHATKIALTPHFFTRELDTIAVKWKSEWVRIYELVGYGEEYVNREKYIVYERALGLYRAGDYRGAGKLWQTQVSLDPPSRIMMLRCAEILKGNMQVKDGVYHMTHK
jgi:class 3 adenylate cyclase/CHASE2 domain-containing sensor protein